MRAECCVLLADLALSRLSGARCGELVEVAKHAEERERWKNGPLDFGESENTNNWFGLKRNFN